MVSKVSKQLPDRALQEIPINLHFAKFSLNAAYQSEKNSSTLTCAQLYLDFDQSKILVQSKVQGRKTGMYK